MFCFVLNKLHISLFNIVLNHFIVLYVQHSDYPIATQINDCKLALEGPVAYLDHYGVADPLSCKAVFQQLSYRKRVHHLKIYLIVHWSELNHIGPPSQIPLQTNNSARLFHLLKVSHIFPAVNNMSKLLLRSADNLGVFSIIMPTVSD